MNKDYYPEYYHLERTHWWFTVREKIIRDRLVKTIGRNTTLNILNIGVATGRSSEMLSEFGKVTSIEYDEDCCHFTREKTGLPVVQGSILELPFKNEEFDLVCAFDVIEHVEDDQKAVDEMTRVCKSGGICYITVPAFMSLWSQHDVVNQHFRRYRLQQVNDLFTSYKGKNVKKTYFNSFLFPPIWLFRRLANVLPKKQREGSGSDFSVGKNNSLHFLLRFLFNSERPFLKYISFPAGVSILYVWRKS